MYNYREIYISSARQVHLNLPRDLITQKTKPSSIFVYSPVRNRGLASSQIIKLHKLGESATPDLLQFIAMCGKKL